MKKILIFAAATAAVLSSCSKNEVSVNPTDPSRAIDFSTYVGTVSKAGTTVKTDFAQNDVFTIDAYFTESADFKAATSFAKFMQDQDVEKGATDWTYSPKKYWPNDAGDQVSFFAISNGSSTGLDFNDTAVTTAAGAEFTYSNATAGDLLVASLLNKTEQAANLTFSFKHALSMLEFNAKTAADYDDATTVTIDSIAITSVANQFTEAGTFVFDPATEGKVTCTASTAVASKEIGNAKVDTEITDKVLDEAFFGLTIIPQGTADTEMANVKVFYTVKTTDSTTANKENDSEVENTATFKLDKVYAPNTKYTYNIIISLTEVKVEGTISADWATPAGSFDVAVNTSTPDSKVTVTPAP